MLHHVLHEEFQLSTNSLVAEASISYVERVRQIMMFSHHFLHEEWHLGDSPLRRQGARGVAPPAHRAGALHTPSASAGAPGAAERRRGLLVDLCNRYRSQKQDSSDNPSRATQYSRESKKLRNRRKHNATKRALLTHQGGKRLNNPQDTQPLLPH